MDLELRIWVLEFKGVCELLYSFKFKIKIYETKSYTRQNFCLSNQDC